MSSPIVDNVTMRLWKIHDQYYDLTPMMSDHPGGLQILQLTRGTECTALFETYHIFSDVPRNMLWNYGTSLYAGKGSDPLLEEVRSSARDTFHSRSTIFSQNKTIL